MGVAVGKRVTVRERVKQTLAGFVGKNARARSVLGVGVADLWCGAKAQSCEKWT